MTDTDNNEMETKLANLNRIEKLKGPQNGRSNIFHRHRQPIRKRNTSACKILKTPRGAVKDRT